MDYNQALEYIYGTAKFGSKLSLDSIKGLLGRLGNPQNDFKYIHVGGTNGKGSVTAMIAHILKAGGYKTGMFISPSLENFTERIQVDLEEMPREDLPGFTFEVKIRADEMVNAGLPHPTEFEIATAICLLYFSRRKVDIAVVEVGLGGRLDATNVVEDPLLSVITSIGYDHVNILGTTLKEIAFEKAGIIKAGRPVVSYPQLPEAARVIRRTSKEKDAALYEVSPEQISTIKSNLDGNIFDFRYKGAEYKNLELNLLGEYQQLNAAVALTAIEVAKEQGLEVSDGAIRDGLYKTKWPGRLEVVSRDPITIIDGAHNASGAEAFSRAIRGYFIDKKIVVLMGVLRDKDADSMVKSICPLSDQVVITRPDNPRAMDVYVLAEKASKYCDHITIEPDIEKAIDKGIEVAGFNGVMLVCGSLYLAGAARRYILGCRLPS